jgi:hypothetical protein
VDRSLSVVITRGALIQVNAPAHYGTILEPQTPCFSSLVWFRAWCFDGRPPRARRAVIGKRITAKTGAARMFSYGTPRTWTLIATVVAVLFGLLTIKEGGSVLLDNEQAVRAAGDYVPFVLWFNTAAGFAYVAAGVGLWLRQRWAVGLSFVIAASSLIILSALAVHVAVGGAYEIRTVVAMMLRSAVWVAISILAYRFVWQPQVTAQP